MSGISLNKDQKQKLALSSMGFAVLLYCYFTFFLGPLNVSRAKATKEIAALQVKIDASKGEMKKADKLATQAAASLQRYAAIKAMSPDGAPIAWFPPRIKAFLANEDIDKVAVRLESSNPFKQPELANFIRNSWIVDLPQSEFIAVGAAVAELENAEPLFAVARVQIHTTNDSPQFQQTTLSLVTTLLKR